jgi:hypothetical protein
MKIRTLAATILALGLSACSAEFAPVAIYSICAPPQPDATSGACVYPATCEAGFAGTPLLDVTTAQVDFQLPFQINNALTNNASVENSRINTNDAFIQSLEMTYSGATLQPWSVSQAITVPTAGSSGALLRLIPVQYFPALVPPGSSTTSLVISVRARGILASQDSFTTAWFQVPVTICAGCLDFNVCGTGSTLLASCPGTAPGAISPGQSAAILCSDVAAP